MVAPVLLPPRRSVFPGTSQSFRSKRSAAAIPRPPRAAAPPPSPVVPSLRPPTGRANHLRSKLLKTLTPPPPTPHPALEAAQAPLGGGGGGGGVGREAGEVLVEEDDPVELQPPLPPLSHGAPTAGYALVLEERETALVVHHNVGDQRLSFPTTADTSRLLLELSVYLVGLLGVQTVCAVWLFGGAGGEQGKGPEVAGNAGPGEAKGAGLEMGERGVEFERTVSAIQAMAREARAAEAREAAEKDGVGELMGDIMEEVDRRVGRLRKGMPGIHLSAKALSNGRLVKGDDGQLRRGPAKGFNGSKGSAAATRDIGNGSSQQIDHDVHFKKPSQLHARRKSNVHGCSVPEKDPVVSDLKNSHTLGDINASDQEVFEEFRNSHMIGDGETWNIPVSQELAEDSSPFGGIHHKQTDSSNKVPGMASKTKKMGIPNSQSFLGKKHGSSSTYGNSYTNSEIVSDKKTEHKDAHERAIDSQADAINQLWWLKLPYVLGIFLHRGSDRKEFKGLYSLKLDSSSEEGSLSYTIVFEDRVDATNFCYLLESFFEDLVDVFADIVPLSIQELHDAVKSNMWKVIVVRKGQLRLYAGQPLAEAEMQLRAMLD